MRTKHKRILSAIFDSPTRSNLKFSDIESLLISLGGDVSEGTGSRISITVSEKSIFLHRPHPGKEAKKYQVEMVREFLMKTGVTP
ncbi:MAG: pilus assembly protein HicB [Deltaproteobacteria bacterium]|nr:MAG: pilus assembly protein HicB [Deltaproteobacteria bacterium]